MQQMSDNTLFLMEWPQMQKMRFVTSRHGQLVGYIAGIPCILDEDSPRPGSGETWLVELTGTNAARTHAYVRAVRPWRGTPEDRRAVLHAHVDFRNGIVRFRSHFVFPMSHTSYAQTWKDYQLLAENIHAVIIRGDKAIRWNRRGKPPQVLPLSRFATKYKRQPLLGDPADIAYFQANLEVLRAKAIEEAKRRNEKMGREVRV